MSAVMIFFSFLLVCCIVVHISLGCEVPGWFGPQCQYKCQCADNVRCNSSTGHCSDGRCLEGCFGPTCQYGCEVPGWFGDQCQYKCQCADNVSCNSSTGHCSDGRCLEGWFGPTCQYAEPQPSLALVIVVTVLAVAVVIFTAVMVIVINCLCRKIKNLKKELAKARDGGQVEDGNDELNNTHHGVLDAKISNPPVAPTPGTDIPRDPGEEGNSNAEQNNMDVSVYDELNFTQCGSGYENQYMPVTVSKD